MGLFGSIAGPLIEGGLSLIGGNAANKASAKSARQQMEFQERMARNSHQYEVEDLKAAGLNPILSANGGAATPSGSSYTAQDVVTPAVSSAQASRRQNIDRQLALAEIDKKKSERDLNDNLGAKAYQDRLLTMLQHDLVKANTATAVAQAKIASSDVPKAQLSAEWYRSRFGRLSTAMDKLNPLKFFQH